MDDTLEPWDFKKEFTIQEAASLMLGLRPDRTTVESGVLGPVLERMASDYKLAKLIVSTRVEVVEQGGPAHLKPVRNEVLICTACHGAISELTANKEARGELPDFYASSSYVRNLDPWTAMFHRYRLDKWIKANGLPSKYDFSDPAGRGGVKKASSSNSQSKWPWGEHHTEALGHLEAAAKAFWTTYDSDKIGTAPTNKEVSDWLQKERGVTERMADSIASILRADGIRPGPR